METTPGEFRWALAPDLGSDAQYQAAAPSDGTSTTNCNTDNYSSLDLRVAAVKST